MPQVVWCRKPLSKTKKVLYVLVLPAMDKDKPPLPITELITSSHSIPSISHRLMEFKRKLSYTTKRRIRQVETDYSWTLINSVLLSFNKENISVYLTRAFEIVSGQTEQSPNFTVLHLCSAYIVKAVSQAFGKKTGDRHTRICNIQFCLPLQLHKYAGSP